MADKDEYRYLAQLEEAKQPEVSQDEEKWNIKLTKIKGVGFERAKDLGRIYKSEEELIKALKEDKVSLRNDVVKLLKLNFQLNNKGG